LHINTTESLSTDRSCFYSCSAYLQAHHCFGFGCL